MPWPCRTRAHSPSSLIASLPVVAREISERLASSPHGDGQALVYHDLLGFMHHPWHAAHALKFCKQHASAGSLINNAVAE